MQQRCFAGPVVMGRSLHCHVCVNPAGFEFERGAENTEIHSPKVRWPSASCLPLSLAPTPSISVYGGSELVYSGSA